MTMPYSGFVGASAYGGSRRDRSVAKGGFGPSGGMSLLIVCCVESEWSTCGKCCSLFGQWLANVRIFLTRCFFINTFFRNQTILHVNV